MHTNKRDQIGQKSHVSEIAVYSHSNGELATEIYTYGNLKVLKHEGAKPCNDLCMFPISHTHKPHQQYLIALSRNLIFSTALLIEKPIRDVQMVCQQPTN